MSKQPVVSISVLPPSGVAPAERTAFEELVLEGGEVNPRTLPGLVDRALALAFVRLDGQLVGVGAIKRPYASHRKNVFQWAQAGQDPTRFEFELGWIYIRQAGRDKRLTSRIVGELMPSLNGAFAYATSRVDNARMHTSLRRFGFKPVGVPYPSKQNEPEIQLFVCV